MPNSELGSSSEQHAKAGEQGHKNTTDSGSKESGSEASTRGSSHEQQVKAGQQSHKNTSGSGSKEFGSEGSTRGGSHEQHVKAGQQSYKNSDDYRGRFVRPLPPGKRRATENGRPS